MDAEDEHHLLCSLQCHEYGDSACILGLDFLFDFIPCRCQVANYTRNNSFLLFPVSKSLGPSLISGGMGRVVPGRL